MKKKLRKVFILVNDPIFVYQHLLPIIDKLKYETKLYIVSSYRSKFALNFSKVKVINIPIKREPSFSDIYVFLQFLIIRIKHNPTLCISFTPKAGLINSLTSFLGGKSCHYFTGQRWANLSGLRKKILKYIDKFIIFSCSKIYCDSESQSNFISKELNVKKIQFFGKGSISGVNIKKFNINKQYALRNLIKINKTQINNLLKFLKIAKKNRYKIIFFVGRVNRDKGIRELIDGFKLHNKEFEDSYLLIIGPNELNKLEYSKIKSLRNCLHIEYIKDINLILKFAFCLILPSYREGFGSIIIEAAASKIPIIASDIPGPTDFISHMDNGFLIKPKDIEEVKNSLNFFRENRGILKKFTNNSFKKCCKYFSEDYVCNLFVNEILKNI